MLCSYLYCGQAVFPVACIKDAELPADIRDGFSSMKGKSPDNSILIPSRVAALPGTPNAPIFNTNAA